VLPLPSAKAPQFCILVNRSSLNVVVQPRASSSAIVRPVVVEDECLDLLRFLAEVEEGSVLEYLDAR